MELLIAILIAMGSLTSSASFTTEYQMQNQAEIEKARIIMESDSYTNTSTGGVVINEDIDG